MSAPGVGIYLRTPIAGYTSQSIAERCELDTGMEITEAIESPAEVNRFVAPDVSLRVYDDPKAPWLLALFSQITPTATDWLLMIDCDGWQRFTGYILPNTVQIDDAERWVSFTAIGLAGRLAATSAEASTLRRNPDSGWTVKQSNGNNYYAEIEIEKISAQATCEYVTDDILEIGTAGGNGAEVKVLSVEPVGESVPFYSFKVYVSGMVEEFTPGSTITLVTPFLRNVALKTVVDALFVAAGLPATTALTYLVDPISGAATQFASMPNLTGLEGTPQGVSSTVGPTYLQTNPIVGTSSGAYAQNDPPSGNWSVWPGYPSGVTARPNDWQIKTNNSEYLLYGRRFTQNRVNPLDPNSDREYIFWCYYYPTAAFPVTQYRYGLGVTVDNITRTGSIYTFSTSLYIETATDGRTWTRVAATVVNTGTTTTDLHAEVGQTCGIDMTGHRYYDVLVFTEPVGGGDVVTYRVSQATLDLVTVTSGVITGVRGQVMVGGRIGIYQTDTLRDSVPTARFYNISELSALSLSGTAPIPPGLDPFTLRFNDGDLYWYALANSPARGVELLSFSDPELTPRVGWLPPQIAPPATYKNTPLSLAVIHPTTYVSGPYPMIVMVGSSIWWIAYSFAGVLPYVDVGGLSCGDALAQLATLVDAYFYVDRLGVSWFRSRGTNSGKTIGTGRAITSTRIDDTGCLTFRRSGVWYKAVRYVTVTNDGDETITGAAGDPAFIGNELALAITNRFIYPTSFARALAENTFSYLGRALVAVEVEHLDDGRDYSVGNTFTAMVNGVLKTFQIIDVTHRPAAATIHVQGIEL